MRKQAKTGASPGRGGQGPPTLEARARQALVEAGLRDAHLVVAVSGGPDSLALLHTLAESRSPLGLTLSVAHLDHGLRPDSAEDAQFVAEQSRSLGLECYLERADVQGHRRRHRLSLEQAAREMRYGFLGEVARKVGAAAVALGHTADDQAETVLLHLVRGSGLGGLRGMTSVSSYPDRPGEEALTLVRPLLEVGREETEAWCRARGLTPRLDATNRSLALPRSYLRWEVIPRLAGLNPAVREALRRLSVNAARDMEYIEAQVGEAWPRLVREAPGGLAVDRTGLAELPGALQRHLLRRAFGSVQGSMDGLDQDHVEAMVGLLQGSAGAVMDLPGGLRLEVQYEQALITSGAAVCPLPALDGEHSLTVPGETEIGEDWRVTVARAPAGESTWEGACVAYLDQDALGAPLWVRSRRPGDRFHPLGLHLGGVDAAWGPLQDLAPSGEAGKAEKRGKKLQDFMVDAHVPRSWRDRIPLVVTPRGIAWVVGWRTAHWARVTPGTRDALRVEFALQTLAPSSFPTPP